jgi:hypothetical protein
VAGTGGPVNEYIKKTISGSMLNDDLLIKGIARRKLRWVIIGSSFFTV